MICSVCGKKFKPGNKPNGLPNGVGVTLDDGRTANFCYYCIMKMGFDPKFAEYATKKAKEGK